MIQRKQTLFLLLAAICFILIAFVPFGVYATKDAIGNAVQHGLKADAKIYLAICTSAGLLLCIFAIALFKKRPIQKLLCLCAALIGLSIAVIEYFIVKDTAQSSLSFGVALAPLAGLLCMMAHRGVSADEKLIKSLDRLRD
ncbi:MAG: hypothetical protein RL660_3011 [Bacteroidota bacterium]|jgi:peptidoglycan/LPS O-acetylase OafA/YrhL